MKKKLVSIVIIAALSAAVLFGVHTLKLENPAKIAYRFASESEGASLLLANKEYYSGFSQNDIDYRMQRRDATMEDFLGFASEQVMSFTDEEMALINAHFASM